MGPSPEGSTRKEFRQPNSAKRFGNGEEGTLIQENSDPIAMTAQADIHRFFESIIRPALVEFEPGAEIPGGVVNDMDVFLENARAATHNALCFEMRRAFGLIIGAMFERQLRFWLASGAPDQRKKIEKAKWDELEPMIGKLRGMSLDSAGVAAEIHELWSVANAVRHGEGPAMTKLVAETPRLWEHLPTDAGNGEAVKLVGNMRVRAQDLWRYTLAIMKFWHAAGASSIPGI